MDRKYLVAVPGTGQSIALELVAHELPAIAEAITVPKALPRHLREIVQGAADGTHWLQPVFGPRVDPDGSVFLGRAFREVGAVLHAADWTGAELAANRSLVELPERAPGDFYSKSVSVGDRVAASELLDKPVTASTLLFDDDWKRARALRQEALAYVRPARRRAVEVIAVLEQALAKGDISTRLQQKQGGALSEPRAASEWLVPYGTLFRRMLTCSMDSSRPFAADGDSHWIFLDRVGVNRLLAEVRKRTTSGTERDARPVTTRAHVEAFKARVRDAVHARPAGPSEREQLISEGRAIYRLPKEDAEQAYKEAIDNAGIAHEWSRRGPKPKVETRRA